MSLTVINFTVSTNEDWRDTLTFETGDPAEHLDLTGSSFVCHLRSPVESLQPDLILSTGNGRLDIAATPESADDEEDWILSSLAWNVPATEMALVEPGVYPFDVVWTDVDGNVDRIIEGTVTVQRGITR